MADADRGRQRRPRTLGTLTDGPASRSVHGTPASLATHNSPPAVRGFPALRRKEAQHGATAFRAHVAGIHDRWPDLAFEEHALYITADTGVAEWTARATAQDGGRLEWDGLDVINCREGQIKRNAVYSSGHAPRVLGT